MKISGKMIWRWMIPAGLLLLLEILKYFPDKIEKYYAQGIYPMIGKTLRFLFGGLPFSLGDVLIAILIIGVVIRVILFLANRKPGKWKLFFNKQKWGRALRVLLWVYFCFQVFWGLNYYRLGSAHLLNIEPIPYTNAEADSLVFYLQERLQQISFDSAAIEQAKTNDRNVLEKKALEAYTQASGQYPFLSFQYPSLKPILLGKLQAYAGYAGYLFPFTGEANADFYVPAFSLPFTVCHEMAHQLGFGTESEANLAGFLAARASTNPAFRYSAYAGVHQYALVELYRRDSILAKGYIEKLPPLLKKDRQEQYRFQKDHESFLQPVMDAVYTLYLQGNNQPQGLESYNRVVAWLIAYGKKYGWNNI